MQIRSFLLERGLIFATGPANLRSQMPLLLEDADQNLTPLLSKLLEQLWQKWKSLDSDIERDQTGCRRTCCAKRS